MKLRTLIFLAVLLIGIMQAVFVIDLEFMTFLTGAISYLLVIVFILILRQLNVKSDFEYRNLMLLYFVLGIIAIIRGLFEAQNYWDWKFMIFDTALVMLMPIVSFIGSSKDVMQAIYYNYIRYLIPISFFVYFGAQNSINTDGFARFLSPLYLIILFLPIMTKKWKIIIILLVLLSFFSDMGARSNILRIIAAFGLMLTYYFRTLIQKRLLQTMLVIFFTAPFVLFILGITDTFNIFKIGENSEEKYSVQTTMANGEERDDNLTSDTRTFIYQEVIGSSIYRNTWLFGESAAAGYISLWFEDDTFGSKGRARSEVCILNVFNVLGIIGVIIFTLISFFASYLCVNRSNNYICKLIGLFIAFRWSYSWVEEFFDFDMNYIFLWLTIGLCFSRSFRGMNDNELKTWVLGIFNKRHMENTDLIKTSFILKD